MHPSGKELDLPLNYNLLLTKISIVDDKGVIISGQVKICNQFNNFFVDFFVNIGQNKDKTILENIFKLK